MTPRPKDSTREKTAETRQRILEAAEAAFAEKGFDGANMREIAQAAGVNKFMLYYHFDNKETLFLQVVEMNFKPLFQRLAGILARDSTLEEAITDIYRLYAELFAAKGERLRPFMAREIAAGAPYVGKFFTAQAPRILDLWRSRILAFIGKDTLPDRQLQLAVYSIMIGIVSNFLMYPVFAEIMAAADLSPHDHEVQHHVVQFLLGGLRTRLATEMDIQETTKERPPQ